MKHQYTSIYSNKLDFLTSTKLHPNIVYSFSFANQFCFFQRHGELCHDIVGYHDVTGHQFSQKKHLGKDLLLMTVLQILKDDDQPHH